ncbi:hypothetical protein JCM24511_09852 [Saitozyma sp. JCM 24511]|nr:hypothetical protein JCM24511_09852 [Saitozyma sp. JCM 24511]
MKYGKEFQQILRDSHFPEEWKSSAIEYGQLKKLIKDVVAELSSMGLSPDVLHKLLDPDDTSPSPPRSGGSGASPRPEPAALEPVHDEGDILEFEFESDGSPETLRSGRTTHRPKEVLLDPILDDAEPGPGPSSRQHQLATSPDGGGSPHHRKFRLRLLSDTAETSEGIRRMSVEDVMQAQSHGDAPRRESTSRPRRIHRAVVDPHGVKAEYVLTGDAAHPMPQIRLHLSASPSQTTSEQLTPAISTPAESDDPDADADSDDERHPSPEVLDSALQSTSAGTYVKPIPTVDIIPPSPSLQRVQAALSPIWALASGVNEDGMKDLSLGDAAVEQEWDYETELEPGSGSDPQPDLEVISSETQRDFIIPLASDQAFFSMLTAALMSLSAFHAAQQAAFRAAVESLCRLISQSIQPSSSVEILPTPLTPSTTVTRIGPTSKGSRKDLYAWREIFTLWIEAEIFESGAERSRGERTVDQAETRLQKFASEVVKRGLGDRRTMKGKKVKAAWEEFLRLNVLLLDLKRFQTANINAARKILKKHDKRTALTASSGFQSFVRSTLSSHVDASGNVNTWAFYNSSLPHILLASLTDTLLPILPSLDDYACLICTSIAFKPIRLDCGHLFCVRCLVKMQRAGKAECPLCRSKVVLLADKSGFMKEWFPKEVKAKQKENEEEVVKEHAADVGLDTRCVVM